MNWLWGCCGDTLFDVYSLNHFGWFMAITLILYPFLRRATWMGVIGVSVFWELVEVVVAKYSRFPLAGAEEWINKVIGDPISNLLGCLLAMIIIKSIEKSSNLEELDG